MIYIHGSHKIVMSYIGRRDVERRGWIRSIGIPLDKEHLRESPPGTRHAVFERGAECGVTHYDTHNPHAGLGDLVKHLWDWNPLVTSVVTMVGFDLLFNKGKYTRRFFR